uniref:Uncharacterized protein n=1 Tax=Oryza sativa subsp. japonica TaxID=39947 RepID=Q84SW3_ORYSJ|nr:hypothetical protein [Oryza sativa Japonica Group]
MARGRQAVRRALEEAGFVVIVVGRGADEVGGCTSEGAPSSPQPAASRALSVSPQHYSPIASSALLADARSPRSASRTLPPPTPPHPRPRATPCARPALDDPNPIKNVAAAAVRERYSVVSDLAGCGFEEEGYPVVDYESDIQTAMSTTLR